MLIKKVIQDHIQESINTKQSLLADSHTLQLIHDAAEICSKIYLNGRKTMFAGNGGSAADAQHLAGEFVSRFNFDRPGLPSLALSTDTSIITSISNDYGYARLFSRQIQANGVTGDVFFGISTSGNSENIIMALSECKEKGIYTIGLTGSNDSKMDELCDICIKVPSTDTPRIQECHILIGHIICCIVEENIFGNLNPHK